MIEVIISILLFLSLPLLFWYSMRADLKDIQKQRKIREEKDDAWLEAELAKPKSAIYFVTMDSRKHRMYGLDPYVLCRGDLISRRVSSQERALSHSELSFKAGYFMDNKSIMYPTSSIAYVYIGLEDENE